LSSLYLLELNYLVNQNGNVSEELKSRAQLLLNQAENSSRLAIAKDPTNYLNWLSLASIYEQILPLGVKGAYENGKKAINNAIALNPKNPGLYARLAKIEMAVENFSLAEDAVKKALELRPSDQDLVNFLDQLKARTE
jgi:Tfp pilus assembly protein PilF